MKVANVGAWVTLPTRGQRFLSPRCLPLWVSILFISQLGFIHTLHAADLLDVKLVARKFMHALFDGETEIFFPLSAEQVLFDGHLATDPSTVASRWSRVAMRAHANGLKLTQIDVMTIRDGISKFGPLPNRLKKLNRPGTVVALVHFSHQGCALFLKKINGFWRVIGITD